MSSMREYDNYMYESYTTCTKCGRKHANLNLSGYNLCTYCLEDMRYMQRINMKKPDKSFVNFDGIIPEEELKEESKLNKKLLLL